MDQKTSDLTLVTALGDIAQRVDIQDRNERQSMPGTGPRRKTNGYD